MSHVANSKEEIECLIKIMDMIEEDKISKNTLNFLLLCMVPKNDRCSMLTDYKVKVYSPITGSFVPKTNMIMMSVNKANQWIDRNTNYIKDKFDIKDVKLLRKYISLYMIIHEVEHSYEYLMANNKVEAPNVMVSMGYKYLFDLISNKNLDLKAKIGRFHSLAIYDDKKEDYVLERNANFETTTLLTELALYRKDKEIALAFRTLTYDLLSKSYKDDNLGPMFHTYKDLGMLDKYYSIENDKELTFIDNVRYGLTISEEDRKQLLKKK